MGPGVDTVAPQMSEVGRLWSTIYQLATGRRPWTSRAKELGVTSQVKVTPSGILGAHTAEGTTK